MLNDVWVYVCMCSVFNVHVHLEPCFMLSKIIVVFFLFFFISWHLFFFESFRYYVLISFTCSLSPFNCHNHSPFVWDLSYFIPCARASLLFIWNLNISLTLRDEAEAFPKLYYDCCHIFIFFWCIIIFTTTHTKME